MNDTTNLTVCQRQLNGIEWYNKQPKEMRKGHEEYTKKHKIYKGQDGYNYCKTCRERGSKDQFLWNKPEEYWRLEEIRIRCLEHDEYDVKKVRPIRKNQRVTDEALEEKFEKLKERYIEVSKLKIILGKSHEYPKGFIKVNEPSGGSKMTTVISSTYLTRLSRITGKAWHQKRAFGENGELLVKFTKGPEDYTPLPKKSKFKSISELLQAKEALDKQFERLYEGYDDPDFERKQKLLKRLQKFLEETEPRLQEASE